MLDNTETDATETEATEAAAPKVRGPSRRGTIEVGAGALLMAGDGPDAAYSTADLPAVSKDFLVLFGLRQLLHVAKDEAAAFEALKAGTIPHRESKPKELPVWKQAIAHALVEERKKTAPITLDDALAHAAGISRDSLMQAKTEPLVIKHFRRLAGLSGASVSGLLGLAGDA